MYVRTVWWHLQQHDLSAQRPLLRLPLTLHHVRRALNRRIWTQYWRSVVFPDESRFCLQASWWLQPQIKYIYRLFTQWFSCSATFFSYTDQGTISQVFKDLLWSGNHRNKLFWQTSFQGNGQTQFGYKFVLLWKRLESCYIFVFRVLFIEK